MLADPTSSSAVHARQRAYLLVRLALWTAVGVVLAGLEHLVPSPLPWVKLGVANVAALLVLYLHGWGAALAVNLTRAVVVGLVLGTWTTPVFLLSLTGAGTSVLAMAGVKAGFNRWIGPVGVSAAGAFVHMLAQFGLASLLLVRHVGLLSVAGPSLLLAVAAGVVNGLLAVLLLRRLSRVGIAQA